ncbi:MAG TPA: hypothetical protein VHI31_00100 [Actinomycetota bacterium]|nr:hypothetical protein [Actinomycetota bacterium]
MTEYCKHGLDMATTCRKCGRTKVVEVPNFLAKKNGFTNSIDALEETVRRMNRELAEERVAPRPEPAAAEPAADKTTEAPAPPPDPPERFPWQRR